jgi:hypothetical protein
MTSIFDYCPLALSSEVVNEMGAGLVWDFFVLEKLSN